MAITNYWLSGGSASYPSGATPTIQSSGIGSTGVWSNARGELEDHRFNYFRLTIGSWTSSPQGGAFGYFRTNYSFTTTAQSAGVQFKLEVETQNDGVGWQTVFDRTLPVSISAGTHVMRLQVFNDTPDGGDSYHTEFQWGTGKSDSSGDFQFDVAASTYSVTYNGNGNTSGTAPTTQTGATFYTVASAGTLAKTGYAFTGWNTAANGSGTSYAAGSRIPASGNLTANQTLYAQWTQQVTVTFNANGGWWS